MIVDSSSVDGLNSSVVSEASREGKVVRPSLSKEVKLFKRDRLGVIHNDPLNDLRAGRSSQ